MSTGPKTLCLNMIVKNEMANLPRCLAAVADHIACWVIGDTGSTDGTQDFVRGFFAERDIPGELHSFPFVNFGQARNEALDRALASHLRYDYLLFDDADMEFVAEDLDFRTGLREPAYQLLQRGTQGLAYWNIRLVGRDAGIRYLGVTHEYVDLPTVAQRLHAVWYKDYASGANRPGKLERDAKLLTEALRQDPDNARYWFYLAQSYRDAGKMREAADAYARRAEMGGWREEAWQARLQLARCLRELGDEGGFLSTALAAYNERPQRAEPLYDLARYYRAKGQNDASTLFAERGLELSLPLDDSLFVEEWVYQYGLKEEFAIAAYYSRDAARKDRGHAVCDWLALSRDAPKHTAALARWNVFHYIKPLQDSIPSFETRRVDYIPPSDFDVVCACVTCHADKIFVLLVTLCSGPNSNKSPSAAKSVVYQSRHFLLTLNASLGIGSAAEVLSGSDMPSSAAGISVGWQDTRLVSWRDTLWYSARVMELTPQGLRQQIMMPIESDGSETAYRLTSWRIFVADNGKAAAMKAPPILPPWPMEKVPNETSQSVATDTFCPVTSAVALDGGWLVLIREARGPGEDRTYQHRFVWYNSANRLCKISRQFYFQRKDAECATGIAWHPEAQKLLVSYNMNGCKPGIASFDADDLRNFLTDIEP